MTTSPAPNHNAAAPINHSRDKKAPVNAIIGTGGVGVNVVVFVTGGFGTGGAVTGVFTVLVVHVVVVTPADRSSDRSTSPC